MQFEDEDVHDLFKRDDLIFWRKVYGIITLTFICFGLVGNSLILLLALKVKEVRTKSGCLLCSNAFINITCLLFETVHSVLIVSNISLRRMECIHFIFLYPLVFNVEIILSFALVLDIFLAIQKSTWYYSQPKEPYLLCIWSLALFYGGTILISAHLTWPDNEYVPYCDPITTLHPILSKIDVAFNLFMNTLTVTVFFTSMSLYSKIGKNQRETKGVVKRIKGMIIIYVSSTYTSNLGAVLLGNFPLEPELKIFLQTCMGFFSIFSFAAPFYVCIWKSKDYRRSVAHMIKSFFVTENNNMTNIGKFTVEV